MNKFPIHLAKLNDKLHFPMNLYLCLRTIPLCLRIFTEVISPVIVWSHKFYFSITYLLEIFRGEATMQSFVTAPLHLSVNKTNPIQCNTQIISTCKICPALYKLFQSTRTKQSMTDLIPYRFTTDAWWRWKDLMETRHRSEIKELETHETLHLNQIHTQCYIIMSQAINNCATLWQMGMQYYIFFISDKDSIFDRAIFMI